MEQVIAITPNYQIHIPLKIRQQLGIKASSKAKISTKGNQIIIEPLKQNSVLELAGKYQNNAIDTSKIDVDNIRDFVDYGDL